MVMEEINLTAERLGQLVSGLLHDRTSLKSMSAAAKGLARPGAAARLLKECRAVITESM